MELSRKLLNNLVMFYKALPDNMIGDVRKDQEVRTINQFIKLADKLIEANKPHYELLEANTQKAKEIEFSLRAQIAEDKSNLAEIQAEGTAQFDAFLAESNFAERSEEMVTVDIKDEELALLKEVFEKHGGKVTFPKGTIAELSKVLKIE